MNFTWNNSRIENYGHLFGAANRLADEAEGARFMQEYTAYLAAEGVADAPAVAVANIGYLSRYGDDDTYRRIISLTGAVHPIFTEA